MQTWLLIMLEDLQQRVVISFLLFIWKKLFGVCFSDQYTLHALINTMTPFTHVCAITLTGWKFNKPSVVPEVCSLSDIADEAITVSSLTICWMTEMKLSVDKQRHAQLPRHPSGTYTFNYTFLKVTQLLGKCLLNMNSPYEYENLQHHQPFFFFLNQSAVKLQRRLYLISKTCGTHLIPFSI